MKKIIWSIILLQCISQSYAQKHAVSEEDYLTWKKISNQKISEGGELVSYSLDQFIGDSYLYIQQSAPFRLDSFERGSSLSFPANHKFAVFKILPGYDTLRM